MKHRLAAVLLAPVILNGSLSYAQSVSGAKVATATSDAIIALDLKTGRRV